MIQLMGTPVIHIGLHRHRKKNGDNNAGNFHSEKIIPTTMLLPMLCAEWILLAMIVPSSISFSFVA